MPLLRHLTDVAALSGNPAGDVYLQTRCGGSGRGGGYRVTTYSAWVAATWDFGGGLASAVPLASAPDVDPAFSATDAHGDQVFTALSAITSSTVTATAVGSAAPTVTAVASGPATTALVGPLQPLTTYEITVVSTDNAGASDAIGRGGRMHALRSGRPALTHVPLGVERPVREVAAPFRRCQPI